LETEIFLIKKSLEFEKKFEVLTEENMILQKKLFEVINIREKKTKKINVLKK